MFANFIKVLLSNIITVVLNFINIFVFPSILGIEEYSHYQTFLLYVGYTNILHLGIASGMFINYGGKEYGKLDKKQYKSEILLLYCVLTFFTAIGLMLSAFTGEKIFFYVTLVIYPVCTIASYKALYQAWGRFTSYSLLNVVPVIGQLVIVFSVLLFRKTITSKTMIFSYIIIYYLVFAVLVVEFALFVRKTNSNKLLSKENMVTTFNGFIITLGNYINTLIHSVDKQFVKIIFTTQNFAMYAFAISTQSIMTIFITALAQPLYPELAKGNISSERIKSIKEMLIIFGSFSGCSYFTLKFIITIFIPKYIDSIDIIRLYFSCFPAMAVINAIYLNLYKVTKQIKKYIITLLEILVTAIILNTIIIKFTDNYVSVALATVITYYFWLYFSSRHFNSITISLKDTLYFAVFLLIYFAVTLNIDNVFIGGVVYLILICILGTGFYKSTIFEILKRFFKK